VAVAPRALGAALVSAAGDATDGVLAARTEIGISAIIAVMASLAKAARAALPRAWERAERAFTLLTLLSSYAGRSRCHFSLLFPGGAGPRSLRTARGS
jgi:hypothetical protein